MTRRKIHVSLIMGHEGYGVERVAFQLGQGIRRSGEDLVFLSLHNGVCAKKLKSYGYDVRIFLKNDTNVEVNTHTIRILWTSITAIAWVANSVKALNGKSIVFQHNQLLPMAGMVHLMSAIPVIWYMPNTISKRLPFELQAKLYQLFCRLTNIIPVGNSHHTAKSLGDDFVSPKVVYYGLDPEHFCPDGEHNYLTKPSIILNTELPVFAIIARVVPTKAQDRVVQAAIQLFKSGYHFYLIIVGGPTQSQYYQEIRRSVSNYEEHIRLVPPVEDPRPWFSLADVIINSRTGPEPLGLTILEAMLMRKPVLAYRAGGPAETVLDRVTGWLIEDSTVESYQEGIRRALNDRAHWKKMGEEGRTRATLHYSVEAMTQKYLELVASDRE